MQFSDLIMHQLPSTGHIASNEWHIVFHFQSVDVIGPCDLLVNSAGMSRALAFEDTDILDFKVSYMPPVKTDPLLTLNVFIQL